MIGIFGKKRSKEAQIDPDIIDKLDMLARAEQRIADFLQRCAEARPDEEDVWRRMADGARRHVEYIGRMKEIYTRHPDQFQLNQSIDIAAIRLLDLSLRELPGKRRLEEMNRTELLESVKRIKNSPVGVNYGKVLKSDNPDFKRIAARLEAESAEQRQTITALIID